MATLYFLIVVFVAAILISFYYAQEAFTGGLNTDASGNVVSVRDNSGNTVPMPPPGPAVDASGNVISTRLKDLISVLTQSNLNVAPATAQQAPVEIRPASTKEKSTGQEPTLDQYYQSLKPVIQKDIAQAVQQQFERSTVLPKAAPSITPSVAQGASWPSPGGGGSCGRPQPDMNNYIRKDSIPCWGCTLDY